MKIQKLFLPILILAFFFSGSYVQAQSANEKEQEQKIKELEKKLQQALKQNQAELEKAYMASKKAQEESLAKIVEDQMRVQKRAAKQYDKAWSIEDNEHMKEWEVQGENLRRYYDQQKDLKNNRYRIVEPDFEFDSDAFRGLSNVYFTSGNRERTALTIRKDLDGVTLDTKFKYEVSKGAHGINFNVEGIMDEGTLMIKLIKPNGTVLQEIEISQLADINWNQNINWEDDGEEEGNNLGTWTIVVSAKNATGNYKANIKAN